MVNKQLKLTDNNNNLLHVDAKEKVELTNEHRCKNCNKLLGIDNFIIPSFDIKCVRCGEINSVLKDIERQVIITDREGKILYVNHEFEHATGYSAKEILGNKPSLWGKQMSAEFYKDLWHRILKKKEAIAVEMTNMNKNGKQYKVALRISPILNVKGEVEFFLGIETIIRDSVKEKNKN